MVFFYVVVFRVQGAPVMVCGIGVHTASGGFHPFRVGWMNLGVGEMLLSEEPPPWFGILAKSSLVSEFSSFSVEVCCVCVPLLCFSFSC